MANVEFDIREFESFCNKVQELDGKADTSIRSRHESVSGLICKGSKKTNACRQARVRQSLYG